MKSALKIFSLATLAIAGFVAMPAATSTQVSAQQKTKVQIGVPTRAYWPTVVVESALRNKLFEKEGITAELTIYKGGAEELEGLAAGAADMILITPFLVSVGRTKGIGAKMVGAGNQDYAGWHMMVPPKSKIAKVEDLNGKNVAITSTGGGADLLALYTQQARKVQFTRVSVGGGGIVPSLTSGNVDAVVVFPPLSYNLLKSGEAKSLVDFSKEVPLHQAGGWVTTEKNIRERPEVVQKTLNALYGGLAYLVANRDFAIKLIAEIDDIPPDIAAVEYENGIKTLPAKPEITVDKVAAAFELNKLLGATGLIAPAEVFTDQFFSKTVPTKP